MVEKFMPDIYQKSIYYINYDKLYKKGVRCIIFDLDNTITPSYIKEPTKRLKKLFEELKDKGFKLIIMSNSPKYRIEPFKTYLGVDACAFSLKLATSSVNAEIFSFKDLIVSSFLLFSLKLAT